MFKANTLPPSLSVYTKLSELRRNNNYKYSKQSSVPCVFVNVLNTDGTKYQFHTLYSIKESIYRKFPQQNMLSKQISRENIKLY